MANDDSVKPLDTAEHIGAAVIRAFHEALPSDTQVSFQGILLVVAGFTEAVRRVVLAGNPNITQALFELRLTEVRARYDAAQAKRDAS